MTSGRQGEPLERMSSGIPGLDVVLGGGFLKHGTYIIMGPPGAGKTILGNQICFHHVGSGGRAIYVTLLAESHARMIAHLKNLNFFDPTPIAASLTYVSGYRVLEEQGLAGLLDLMRRLIREHQATLLVVDGLVSAEAFAQSELLFKKFIHELDTLVGIVGCTTFLLTNGTTRKVCPEHTMVDGLVELSDPIVGLRAMREMIVRKFRGSHHLRGRHIFEITDAGITVYPRIEALLTNPTHVPRESSKPMPFGVAELDKMLAGGVPSGSTTMLLGPSGSGKTTMGLSFLCAGAKAGEPSLYFGFYEAPARIVAKGEGVGLPMQACMTSGALELMWQPPVDALADALAQRLLDRVKERRVRRLFVDGLAGFGDATIYPSRLSRFFAALSNELRALDVTTIFSQETRVLFGPGIKVPIEGISAVTENIVFIRQVEHESSLRRVASIFKTRETDHDPAIREFAITRSGLVFGGPLDASCEAILEGIVRTARRAAPKKSGRKSASKAAGRTKARGRRR